VKLLFDENLSPKLAQSLADLFPDSQHVFHLFPAGADDGAIWNYATANGMAIVSKDSDFEERSVLQAGRQKLSGCALETA
jgi:predicted nuclease of predicted toxin-antitoxin system